MATTSFMDYDALRIPKVVGFVAHLLWLLEAQRGEEPGSFMRNFYADRVNDIADEISAEVIALRAVS